MTRRRLLWVGIVAVLSAPAPGAPADTYTVDRTDDEASATGCDSEVPGDCSLRGAILKANGIPEASTIAVPAGTYVLTQPNGCLFQTGQFGTPLIQNTTSLCLAGRITLVGAGADSTIIDGNLSTANTVSPVMFVGNNAPVEIRAVTLTRGNISGGSTFGGGAGINNAGVLSVADSVISNNISLPPGGGIYNSGTLTVSRTTLAGNMSLVNDGGGIFNYWQSTLTVTDSTIRSNDGGSGGGIQNFQGTLTVANSTLDDNRARSQGGGISNVGGNYIGRLTVLNTTVSGNRSFGSGGGIYNHTLTQTALNNATITGNATTTVGVGGGLANTDGGIVELRNTIIAGNTAASLGPDCFAFAPRDSDLTSLGHNLIQDVSSCDLSGDLTGNITGQDPQLGVLADNGGPTRTHAPSGTSPVVDGGSALAPGTTGAACAATDQRGFIRPVGARCEIGAVERLGAFSLARVLPARGGNTGTVSAIVAGNGFQSGATVKLTRAGQPDVNADPVQVDAGGSAIAAVFDLRGKPTGAWDLVVVNPDAAELTLAGAFTVEAGRAPELWVDIVGRFFRPGRPSRLTLLYGNRGNIDALGVPLSLTIPTGYEARRLFHLAAPPPQPGQVREDWSQVPVHVETGAQSASFDVPLLLPAVPAGFAGILHIGLTLPPGAQDRVLLAALGDPVLDPTLDPQALDAAVSGAREYVLDNFGVTIPPELVPELEQYATDQLELALASERAVFAAGLGTRPQVYSSAQLNLDLALFGAVRALENAREASFFRPADWTRSGSALLSYLLFAPSPSWAQQNCPPTPKGAVLKPGCSGGPGPDEPFFPPSIPPPPGCNPQDPTTFKKCTLTPDHCDAMGTHKVVQTPDGSFCVPINPPDFCPKIPIANPLGPGNAQCKTYPLEPKNSIDPNEKVGSSGATQAQYLMSATPLSYKIFFENLETATASAQEVIITDPLDLAAMDPDTLSLGPISFGNFTVTPAPGVRQYAGGVDLRPDRDLIVVIHAGLDEVTGILSWRLTSIDPDTGQLTEDVDAGFLPPNTHPPDGDGSVAFTIEPRPELPTGTEICNEASIVFDVNPPIATPDWCNTLDRTAPSSQVAALAPIQSSPSFQVQWTGSDSGSGIADYSIHVSVNGAPFTTALADSTDTSLTFAGEPGKTYAFYSVARDLVGNEEGTPASPDAVTAISVPPDRDGDGIPDVSDNCPFYANANLGDVDADGRGDVCECSDQNGDGRNDVSDLLAINVAVFNPLAATALCDGNGDGDCDVRDILAANVEIFSPTSTSTCERYPVPGP
jgi:hypothetical protein